MVVSAALNKNNREGDKQVPGIRNDIIIKRKILNGMFDAAEHVSAEVEQHGLLYECTDLDNELRAAYVVFRDVLHKAIDGMEALVTKHVVNGKNSRKRNSHK
jgi:hypothetical protein